MTSNKRDEPKKKQKQVYRIQATSKGEFSENLLRGRGFLKNRYQWPKNQLGGQTAEETRKYPRTCGRGVK